VSFHKLIWHSIMLARGWM